MTRWARTKSAHRHEKVPSNATPWSKLKPTPEVRSFKEGANRKPNNVVGNLSGEVKRKMPEFKGTNFARQMSTEKVKKSFSVAYGGGSNAQNSNSKERKKFKKMAGLSFKEENNKPVNNSTKTEPKDMKTSQKRKKFKNKVKREVSFKPKENNKPAKINFVKTEPKEVNNSLQDSSAKKKRKQNKFKKGKLMTEIQGTGTTGGNVSKEEKMTNKSLLLVKQEPMELTIQSKKKGSWKNAKKRKKDASTKNMSTNTPNVLNVVGLKSNMTEVGTDPHTNKKKKNKKKRKKISISSQITGAASSSTNSDGPVKSELNDPQSNKTEVAKNTLASKKKKNKLKEKKKRLKKLALSAQSTNATESSKTSGSAVKSELGVQETDDQKQINKEQKKEMHRLRLLANREKKGITMLSDKAEKKLYLIRKSLKKRGKSPEQIKTILRKERRRAELEFRKAQKIVCFRCRMQGHTVATCTTILEDNEQSMGVCFRCGSTEHILRCCPVSKTDGLPFAKCFICESRGHLSSACPKNNLGIFPRGGACLLCKSVNHLKKDCPTLVKDEQEDEPSVAYRATEFGSADAEISDEVKVSAKKKAKVVTF